MSKREKKPKQEIHRDWWFDDRHAAEAEAWLNDLGKQGWGLESVSVLFTTFKRCEPGSLVYACVPNHMDPCDVRDEAKEIFGNAGWTYVLYHAQILVFCAPVGTEAPEVPSDSPRARLVFARRRSRNAAIQFGLLAAALALLSYCFVRTGMLTNILLRAEYILPICFLCFVAVLAITVRAIHRFADLKNRAKRKEGLEISDKLYQNVIHQNKELRRICMYAAILFFVSALFDPASHTIATSQNHLPVLTVADVAGEGRTDSNGDSIMALSQRDILYPAQWISMEFARWQGVDAKSKENKDISLRYGACNARTPWLAALLANQVARYGNLSPIFVFDKAPLPPQADTMGFDRLWGTAWRDGGSTSIVALKGNVVYCVKIDNGDESIGMLAEALNPKIEQKNSP